jgi:hypothetical protein
MKRILTVLMLAILSVSCSSEGKAVKTSIVSSSTAYKESISIDAVKVDSKSKGEEKKDLDIPEGYPKDKIPIYNKSKIISAKKNNFDGFNILLECNEKVENCYKFYEDIFKDKQNVLRIKTIEGYTIAGEKDEYTYSIIINENKKFEEKVTQIIITISKHAGK